MFSFHIIAVHSNKRQTYLNFFRKSAECQRGPDFPINLLQCTGNCASVPANQSIFAGTWTVNVQYSMNSKCSFIKWIQTSSHRPAVSRVRYLLRPDICWATITRILTQMLLNTILLSIIHNVLICSQGIEPYVGIVTAAPADIFVAPVLLPFPWPHGNIWGLLPTSLWAQFQMHWGSGKAVGRTTVSRH